MSSPTITFPITYKEIPYVMSGIFGIENIGALSTTNITISGFKLIASTRHCKTCMVFVGII